MQTRFSVWKTVLAKPWRWLVAIPFGVLGVFQGIREEFFSPELQDLARLPNWLPEWRWQTWIVIALAVLVFAVLEGAYQFLKKLDPGTVSEGIGHALKAGTALREETITSDDAFADWRRRLVEWVENTSAYLRLHRGEGDRQLFEQLPQVMAADIIGSFSAAHTHERLHIEARLKTLRRIVERI